MSIMVYHQVPTPTFFKWILSKKDVVPRTLILTNKHLVLCDDDYGRWPPLCFPTSTKPTTPQFSLADKQKIGDISGVKFNRDIETYFEILFESSENQSSNPAKKWQFLTEDALEKEKFVQALSKCYMQILQVPVPVV